MQCLENGSLQGTMAEGLRDEPFFSSFRAERVSAGGRKTQRGERKAMKKDARIRSRSLERGIAQC